MISMIDHDCIVIVSSCWSMDMNGMIYHNISIYSSRRNMILDLEWLAWIIDLQEFTIALF